MNFADATRLTAGRSGALTRLPDTGVHGVRGTAGRRREGSADRDRARHR
ncbi:hypothetical protein ACQ4WX_17580 [Streptomyces lasalocidi]